MHVLSRSVPFCAMGYNGSERDKCNGGITVIIWAIAAAGESSQSNRQYHLRHHEMLLVVKRPEKCTESYLIPGPPKSELGLRNYAVI